MLREGRVKEVSEAVKLVGISRSTYYKYKDYIFAPSNETACKKAVFAFMLSHQQGVLSEVLNKFSELGANILTITQSLPIHGNANVVISVDMTNMTMAPDGIMAPAHVPARRAQLKAHCNRIICLPVCLAF